MKNLLEKSKKSVFYSVLKYWDGMMSFPYPNHCFICTKEIPKQLQFFCTNCKQNLRFTHFEKQHKDSLVQEIFYARIKLEYVYSMLYFEKSTSTQNILHHIKYKSAKQLGEYMGQMMGEKVKEGYPEFDADFLIPVSMHKVKQFDRGYNQSKILSKGISNAMQIPILDKTLFKIKNTQSQTKKGRFDRIDNVNKVFKTRSTLDLNNKHIIIVDDVLTTGSTIESCCHALLNSYPNIKLSVFTLAYAK